MVRYRLRPHSDKVTYTIVRDNMFEDPKPRIAWKVAFWSSVAMAILALCIYFLTPDRAYAHANPRIDQAFEHFAQATPKPKPTMPVVACNRKPDDLVQTIPAEFEYRRISGPGLAAEFERAAVEAFPGWPIVDAAETIILVFAPVGRYFMVRPGPQGPMPMDVLIFYFDKDDCHLAREDGNLNRKAVDEVLKYFGEGV